MIVDDADTDMEMTNDPFLEAGIVIPEQLPGIIRCFRRINNNYPVPQDIYNPTFKVLK